MHPAAAEHYDQTSATKQAVFRLLACAGFNVLYIFSACFEILGYVNFALNMNENKER